MNNRFKGDTIPGLIFVLVGFFILVNTMKNPNLTFASNTSEGTPGAGFIPYIFSFLCIFFSIVLMIRGLRYNGSVTFFKITPETKRNIIMASKVGTAVFVFLIVWALTRIRLGAKSFYIFSGILIFYLNIVFERKLKFAVIATTLFILFIYFVFGSFFGLSF